MESKKETGAHPSGEGTSPHTLALPMWDAVESPLIMVIAGPPRKTFKPASYCYMPPSTRSALPSVRIPCTCVGKWKGGHGWRIVRERVVCTPVLAKTSTGQV